MVSRLALGSSLPAGALSRETPVVDLDANERGEEHEPD